MNLVSCPRCGAQFDVSTFAPGAKFVCGACQNLLQVPAAPVVKPVAQPVAKPVAKPVAQPVAKPVAKPVAPVAKPPESPPAAPAAIAKKPAVDRRRAGDAGPAAAQAPAEGRAERMRRQRAEGGDAPRKKNPVPLLIGAVGGIAAVIVGIVYLAGRGDDGKKATEPGPKPVAAEPVEKTFEQLDAAKRIAFLDEKHRAARASAAAVREGVEWFRSKNLADDAKQALEEGHKAFPADPWINGEMGLRERSADLKAILDDEVVMDAVPEDDPDMRFVRGLSDRVKKDKNAAWLPKEDSERLDRAVAALKEAGAKMSDPVYQKTKQYFDNVRLNPAFTGMDFAFRGDFRPYVIFAEAPGPENMGKANDVVERTGKAMTWVYAAWLKFMKEELKLDAPRLEDLGDQRFKVFVFKSRESFDAWHAKNQIGNPGQSVAAYYEHGRERMILMYVGAFDPSIIMHEATHQIIHFYARHFCEIEDREADRKAGKPPEPVSFDDHRLHSAFFWFQEGIAEYFGAAGLGRTEAEWKLGRLQKGRMGFFQFMKGQNKVWPVEEFLFADQAQIQNLSAVKGGGAGMGDELKGLMYSQGWTLVHYFLHGGEGKYRAAFLELMRNEMKGISGKVYLLQAFGLKDANGRALRGDDPKVKAFMADLQAEYIRHFENLMKKGLAGGE